MHAGQRGDRFTLGLTRGLRALFLLVLIGAWLVDVWLVRRDPGVAQIGTAAVGVTAAAVALRPRLALIGTTVASTLSLVLTVTLDRGNSLFFFTEFAALPVLLGVTLAARDRLRWPVGALLVLAAAAISLRGSFLAVELILLASISVLCLCAAAAVRYVSLEEVDRQQSIDTARRDERLDIARDLHDVVGHYVTGMVVLAQAHGFTAAEGSAQRAAFAEIERAGQQALDSIRQLGGVLRDDAARQARTHLDDVIALVEQLRSTHPHVQLDVDQRLRAQALPASTVITLFRVVQEMTTNVRKHATVDAPVIVRIGRDGAALAVSCTNESLGGDVTRAAGSGLGLVGMRERVAAIGGTMTGGAVPPNGWCVEVRLPISNVSPVANGVAR